MTVSLFFVDSWFECTDDSFVEEEEGGGGGLGLLWFNRERFLRLKEEEEFLDGGGGRGLGLFEVDCFVSILFTFFFSFE